MKLQNFDYLNYHPLKFYIKLNLYIKKKFKKKDNLQLTQRNKMNII